MFAQPGYQRPQLNITRLDLFETGTYNDQYRRPFQIDSGLENATRLADATEGGRNINIVSVAKAASSIINPSMGYESRAEIDYGWGQMRYRFLMEIQIGNSMSRTRTRKVLSGYTDHPGLIDKGTGGVLLDPNMLLHVNNVITLRDTEVPTPAGVVTETNVVNNDQLLIGKYTPGYRGEREYSLRPYDLMLRQGTTHMLNEYGDGNVEVEHLTNTFGLGVHLNRRSNLSPTSYLTRLLKAQKEAGDLSDQYLDGMASVNDHASSILSERTVASDPILQELNHIDSFAKEGFVTVMHLTDCCPHLEDIAQVFKQGGVHAVHPTHQAGSTAYWHGSDLPTMLAHMIASAVPGMLADHLIYYSSFLFTNMTIGSGHEFQWTAPAQSLVKGITGHALMDMQDRFRTRFIYEFGPGLTRNDEIGITVKVSADVLNEIMIQIAIENDPPIDFVMPVFCDRSMASVITSSDNLVDNISRSVSNLSTNLSAFCSSATQGSSSPIITSAYNPQPTIQGVKRWG